MFAAVGEGKAVMMKQLLGEAAIEGEDKLPASRVQPTNGDCIWILDAPAASQLSL